MRPHKPNFDNFIRESKKTKTKKDDEVDAMRELERQRRVT